MAHEAAKQAAARAAATLIENNQIVGLGTGSTAAFFVQALAERVQTENLRIRAVPTSVASEQLARENKLTVVSLGGETLPDITVDGADEVGPGFALIKGGGGALVREKMVAAASKRMIVIADESKVVARLGQFALPVAVIRWASDRTCRCLTEKFGVPGMLRQDADGELLITDDGLHLVDLHFGQIADPAHLERELKTVVGVAEVGLFVGIAHEALIGQDDGTVRHKSAD